MLLLLHRNLFCAGERKGLGRWKKNPQPTLGKKTNQAVYNLLENGTFCGCNRSAYLAECSTELGLQDPGDGMEGPSCLSCSPGRFGAGRGTPPPQSCPWVVTAILSLQSFFEGWDASKKKDKTKGRQDHVSTCECL